MATTFLERFNYADPSKEANLVGDDFLNSTLRRDLDMSAAALLLVGSVPFIIPAAASIYLADRGPIIYKSLRVGKGASLFEMYKLRTMRIDADQVVFRDSTQQRMGDERVTPVGRILRKASVDEFVQGVNVLKGEMSVVGSRALVPQDIINLSVMARKNDLMELFNTWWEHYQLYLPGLTGYTAVMYGRGDLTISKEGLVNKFLGDLYWWQNASLELYKEIMLQTFPTIVRGHGVS